MKKKSVLIVVILMSLTRLYAQEWIFGNDPINYPINSGVANGSVTINGLTITAGTGTSVGQIDASSKVYNGISYINRFKFNGSGYSGADATQLVPTVNMPTQRYISFPVSGNTIIKALGMTGSNSSERRLFVTDGTNLIGTMVYPVSNPSGTTPSSPLTEATITYIGGAATIYMYCNASVNLYYLKAIKYVPTVSTDSISSITGATTSLHGTIQSLGGGTITSHGFCWNTTENPTITDNFSDLGSCSTAVAFSNTISGLTSNTKYYVRSYVTENSGTPVYGNEINFTTINNTSTSAFGITTDSITSILNKSAVFNGTINILTASTISSYGFCWNTGGIPTLADNKISLGTNPVSGTFIDTISDLTPETRYYTRSFATNESGTTYGNIKSFSTLLSDTYSITIQLSANGTVNENNASLSNGSVLTVNRGSSKSFTFTPAEGYQISSLTYNGSDVYSQIINNQYTTPVINANSTLHVIFGNDRKTINVVTPGILSTLLTALDKANITNFTVTGNIDARDVKCMRDSMPKLAILDISEVNVQPYGGADGPANGLPSNSFGNNVTGTGKPSLKSIKLPGTLTSIGSYAFYECSGLTGITIPNSVTSIGDDAFFACTGMTGSLIIPNSVTSIGTENAFYYCSQLSDLTIGSGITSIPYYSFGNCSGLKVIRCLNNTPPTIGQSGFISVSPTAVIVPVGTLAAYKAAAVWKNFPAIYEYTLNVSTQSVSSVNTTAKLNGSINVIADNPVIAYGFCWNTTGSPTITDNKVDNGVKSVTGSFTDSITGLSPKTTYYVKAFATDNERTVYGNEMSFTVTLLPDNAGVISGMKTVCQGESAVTYTLPVINNTLSYIWTLPTGVTGTSTSNTINVNYTKDAVSGNITVKGHNDSGNGVASALAITVNQLPVIELRDTAVACGGSVPLFPTIHYTGSGKLKYKWTPSTGLNNDTIQMPFATVTNNIAYTLTVTTPNGCVASNNLKVTILPMDKPEIGIVSVSGNNKNRVVWNKPITTGIASYHIYKETNTSNVFEKVGTVSYDSMSVFVDSLSYPDVKSNKYKLSIFDRNGQESSLSNSHKTMHLSINKGQNNTWNLIWELYEGFAVSTYNIYKGTNANNLNFLDATSGSSTQYSDFSAPVGNVYYQLEVISPSMVNRTKVSGLIQKSKDSGNTIASTLVSYSSSRSNIATNVISGINELGENNKINIYPNPVKNELRIDFEGGSTFEILNLMGQVVYNGNLNKNTIVQTSNLSSGVYLIKFKTGMTFEYKKIIKE